MQKIQKSWNKMCDNYSPGLAYESKPDWLIVPLYTCYRCKFQLTYVNFSSKVKFRFLSFTSP